MASPGCFDKNRSGDEDVSFQIQTDVRQAMPEAIAPGDSPSTEAAFENNLGRVIATLKSAMQHGLRDPQFIGDPIFEDLWDETRFVALEQELDASLAAEHDKVLQLICFNIPAPAGWQPMPETCEELEEQLIL